MQIVFFAIYLTSKFDLHCHAHSCCLCRFQYWTTGMCLSSLLFWPSELWVAQLLFIWAVNQGKNDLYITCFILLSVYSGSVFCSRTPSPTSMVWVNCTSIATLCPRWLVRGLCMDMFDLASPSFTWSKKRALRNEHCLAGYNKMYWYDRIPHGALL